MAVTPIGMDITDEAAMNRAVEEVIAREGRIDVLINDAGYGSFGAIEDVNPVEAKRQFEVNIFGLASLTKKNPALYAQAAERQDNKHLVDGRAHHDLHGLLVSRYEVRCEAFSDALCMEVSDFGIKVSIIEPGGIKTDWGAIAADHLDQSAKDRAYEEQAMRTAANIRKLYSGKMNSNPYVVSKAISRAVNSHNPKCRYLIGFGAKPSVLLHTVLPPRPFDAIIKRII